VDSWTKANGRFDVNRTIRNQQFNR